MRNKLLSVVLIIASLHVFAAEITAVGFSNGDGTQPKAMDVVLNAINGAHKTIYVAAYAFTSKPIAEALIAAKRRGVEVKIVADQVQNSGRYTAVTTTANLGIPTAINGDYKIFHNKFMVIDSECVETGSFNYSASAARSGSSGNAENAIVICDQALAQKFTSQFNYWYKQGEPVKANY